MENMKVLLVSIICLWLKAVPIWAQTAYPFNFPTLDAYSQSVVGLRDSLKKKENNQEVTCFGKPMLHAENKVFLVELRSVVRINVTITQDTLFLEGYSDRSPDGRCRSFVFQRPAPGAQDSLCQGEENAVRVTLGYASKYSAVEGIAGKRGDVEIGIRVLSDYMATIYGQQRPDGKTQARFILAAAQMVSEAVLFSYIQKQCSSSPQFRPNPKHVSMEEEWAHITDAFETANSDGTFQEAEMKKLKQLKDETGKPWVVKKVSDIKDCLGLINYFNPAHCKVQGIRLLPDQPIMSY